MTTIENQTRNGVDTATLFATIDAVKGNNDIAKFQFRATNKWINGTHNQTTIHGFFGAMQEMAHQQPFTFDADHPAILVGKDNAPTPVEFLLRARRLPDGRHRERRRRSRREPHRGRVDRRGRHRPARDPGSRERRSSGSQRVRAAARELQAAR